MQGFLGGAWRKVKPFKKVDEAVVRYLSAAEVRRLVQAYNFDPDSGTLAIRLSKGKSATSC